MCMRFPSCICSLSRRYMGRFHSATWRNRKALLTTDTELRLMAAAAIIGLRSIPKNGYKTPAAIGTPNAL